MKGIYGAKGIVLLCVLCLACVGFGALTAADEMPTEQQKQAMEFAHQEVTRQLTALADKTENAWLREILSGTEILGVTAEDTTPKGVTPIKLTVTFPLLHTGIGEKNPYGTLEGKELVAAAMQSVATGKEEMTIQGNVSTDKDGKTKVAWHGSKGYDVLRKRLSAVAKESAGSFLKKPFLTALSQSVFPHPVRDLRLDVSGGPHDAVLSVLVPDVDGLLTAAADSAYIKAAYAGDAAQLEEHALRDAMDTEAQALYKQFSTAKKAGKTDTKVTFAVDALALPDLDEKSALGDYRASYERRVAGVHGKLMQKVARLPEYPAVERPETARTEGTNVVRINTSRVYVRVQEGNYDCLVKLYRTSNNELASSAYVRGGNSCTLLMLTNNYRMEIELGMIWYGDEHGFGPDAIKSTVNKRFEWKYDYTLGVWLIDGAIELRASEPVQIYE